LFEDNREKLGLEWVAGRGGSARELNSEPTKDSSKGLIGHLNVIHPNLIQVLGASEVEYLEGLEPASLRSVLAQVCSAEPACLIMAGIDRVPPPLIESAETAMTALLRSPVPSVELMWMLRPYLARALAEATTAHGVFLDVATPAWARASSRSSSSAAAVASSRTMLSSSIASGRKRLKDVARSC